MESAHFTDLVRDIIQTSGKVAVRYKYDHVDTEHLLLALIDECLKNPVGGGIVLKIFRQLNVNLFDLIEDIEGTFDDKQESVFAGKIQLTQKVILILKLSYLEAKISQSETIYPEHILLSYLKSGTTFSKDKLTLKYSFTYDRVKNCI
ncbi:Clp protease N-terminal domain-containing protein [uncultured Mucilaginibacter sp.]|uniref:Clp protease N-terminal domain-containing protein n=1 Tax=uncultured Mucilaginibacter sp. TaxID=797541 RepID=UPI0025ECF433|nr:Clp protease N-terminal domain-containing protein [uncultured Mucilaginibacter sp.]